jgi:protein ImuA
MPLITCEGGVLRTQSAPQPAAASFTLDLAGWDQLAPCGQFALGAVHELLFDPNRHRMPKFPALVLARSALVRRPGGTLIWCDPDGTLYPPAIAQAGVPLDRVLIVRPKPADVNWTLAECLRCKGVAAVVCPAPAKLSRVEARRFQLAAERGGGVGVLLRSLGRGSDIYAAATRWLIEPARGERTIQRWKVELVHGHGGRVGQSVLLEKRRAQDYDHLAEQDATDGVAVRSVPAERSTVRRALRAV